MLKALQTLLKGDIIKQKHRRNCLMSMQQSLSVNQISILLWIKALNEFKGEGFEDATFDQKFVAFEAVEDTGFTRAEYDENIGFWIKNGVIEEDEITHEYTISAKGEELFNHLDKMSNYKDETIANMFNLVLKLKDLRSILDCVKKHPQEVMMGIGLVLQFAQLVVAM